MKIAVYTCVTGGYDHLSAPARVDPRLQYHCWTDHPEAVPAPWQVHPATFDGLDPKDCNRFVKMHPHRLPELAGCDVTVYVDGSIDIVGDLHGYVTEWLRHDADMLLFDHPFRRCAYDEAKACAEFGHAPVWTLRRQMARYKAHGFPPQAGLFECGVLIRRHTPEVEATMASWWSEYRDYARRDQLAFTWAAWRHGLRVASLGRSDPRYEQRVFRLKNHAKAGFSPRATATKWVNRLLQGTGLVRLP
jgi:hypothetical protein